MNTTTDGSPNYPRKLQVGVWSAVIIAATIFAEFLSHFIRVFDFRVLFLAGSIAFFLAGVCGSYCGLTSIFRLQGFLRTIAALVALISLYAVLRSVTFMLWARTLP